MGTESSKTAESEAERLREIARVAQEKVRILKEQNAKLQEEKNVNEHHRQQRLHEEERLKHEREKWQREENLRQQQELQQKLYHEQQVQAQFFQQEQLRQQQFQQLQQQQLQQQNAWLPQPIISPLMASAPNYEPNVPACESPKPSVSAQRIAPKEAKPRETREVTATNASPKPKPLQVTGVAASSASKESKPQQTTGIRGRSALRDSKPCQARGVAGKSASRDSKPKYNETPETSRARTTASNVPSAEWTDIDYIQESHGTSRYVAENIVKLLNDDNTIPFIACYRKNMTLGMNADELRNIKDSYDRVKLIKKKANAIIKDIDNQGDGTTEFRAFVQRIKSLNDLEHVHSMYKVIKSSPVEKAREFGLGIAAEAVMKGERIDDLCYLVKPRLEGLKTEEQVKDGIVCILADMINKDESTFETVKILRCQHPVSIETTEFKGPENEKKASKSNKQKNDESKYNFFHNFSSFEAKLEPDQILAINRGQARKFLSVKVNIPAVFEHDFKEYCARRYGNAFISSPMHRTLLTAAFDYVWKKSIKLFVCRRTRNDMTERAEVALTNNFADKIRQLLLTPPVRGKIVVGIYSGFGNSCKLAVVSEQGDVLETETIYPHDANNPRARKETERTLARIVLVHRCTIFAIGNGTGCRETEIFLSELINKGAFKPVNVVYTIVDGAAAAIYSCSREASMEFPDLDANVVSAICIARRLQDPMAELVKIEPKHLVAGMHPQNLPEKQLTSKLNEVIMEVVSFLVVDINTASLSLLKRVAGLNESKAKRIIEWRESSGPLRTRNDLKKITSICSKTFEQCAGFIRIIPETAFGTDHRATHDSINYLDQTWIHPESYDIAKVFLNAANCNLLHLGTKPFIFTVKLFANQGYSALAKKCNTDLETIKIIVEGLSVEKGQDSRGKADLSMFRKNVLRFDDLTVGMVLTGIVRCNKPFGVFVDVGVERDGLIPQSMMGNRTLSVGQRVETKVNNVNIERGRLALALIKCI